METMTVKDVLEITMKNLGNIAVPRSQNEQIGIPIDQAISNIKVCLEAIERGEKAQQEAAAQKQAEETEPQLTIVPAEEAENSAE